MSNDKLSTPKSSKGDAAHAIAKAVLSAIPILGGPVAEIFQRFIQPPLEKRCQAWMEEIGQKLKELEDNGLDLKNLQNDETFISAVMHASRIALQTHQKDKLTALRNAIANVAQGQLSDEAMQHMFLEFIGSLTELHIRILGVFQSPKPPANMSMGGLSSVLEHNIPTLQDRREIYDQFWKDLYIRGLVNTDGLHTIRSVQGLYQKRTTELGDKFLKFISES